MNMLAFALHAGCATAITGSAAQPAQPANVLMLVVDDLRPWLGAYNESWISSPHVDALAAAGGTVFNHAYANQAVCGPSRTSFLTGRRPDSTRLYDFGSYWRDSAAGNFSTLPQYFKAHGYDARSVGKVFHPIGAMKSGGHADDMPYSWSAPPYHPPTQKEKNAPVCNNSDIGSAAGYPGLPDDGALHANIVCPVTPADQPGGTLPDTQSADEAVRLLAGGSGALGGPGAPPFFLAVGFHKPHIPLKFPRALLERYPLAAVPMPPAAALVRPEGLPPVAWDTYDDVRSREDIAALHVPWPYGPVPAAFARLVRQAYAGCVSHMDAEVGRVLAALAARPGLVENTVVVLFGDHGWQLSERGEFAKYSNAEAATHVPLVVRPAVAQAARTGPAGGAVAAAVGGAGGPAYSDALVELVDLWPSLAELAGLPAPPLCAADQPAEALCVEGSSWAPHVRGSPHAAAEGAPASKPAVFSQYPRPADAPRGPSDGNTDLPSLVNITIMGYSVRTAAPTLARYTEWVSFSGNYSTPHGRIEISGPSWGDVRARELYDLAADPLELDNLAADAAHAPQVAALSAQLHAGWRSALPR